MNFVCRGELLDQFVADIAVLGIRLAMLGEEFDIMFFQAIVVLERSKEPSTGKLIGKLVAAVGRSDLFQNRIAPKRNVEPSHAGQHGRRQEVFLPFATFQLRGRNADAFAEAKKSARCPGTGAAIPRNIGSQLPSE